MSLRELRTEWSTVWKPRPPAAAPPAATTTATSPAATAAARDEVVREIVDAPAAAEAPKKARKVFLSGLLGGRVKKEVVAPPLIDAKDELEQYLELHGPVALHVKLDHRGCPEGGEGEHGPLLSGHDVRSHSSATCAGWRRSSVPCGAGRGKCHNWVKL